MLLRVAYTCEIKIDNSDSVFLCMRARARVCVCLHAKLRLITVTVCVRVCARECVSISTCAFCQNYRFRNRLNCVMPLVNTKRMRLQTSLKTRQLTVAPPCALSILGSREYTAEIQSNKADQKCATECQSCKNEVLT